MMTEEKYKEVFLAYYAPLCGFAHQMVPDADECRDLVSTAYAALWAHLSEIEEPTVKAYLYRSVRNLCINRLRKDGFRRQYVDFCLKVTEPFVDDDSFAEQQERDLAIKTALTLMPDTTREILMACYLEKKKYKEVAAERHISTETVKKHIVRALKIMRGLKLKKT